MFYILFFLIFFRFVVEEILFFKNFVYINF